MKQGNVAYKSTHERLSAEGFSPEQPLMARTGRQTLTISNKIMWVGQKLDDV